jgi:deoxyadenosine/deoxycytidine kinase
LTARLISLIGPPAAGKTTLAAALADALDATAVYEDYAGNPFLADAYTGQAEARLPAQLYYLISRVKQLSRSSWPDEGTIVSDYGFCQDRIYARRQLDATEWEIYDQVACRVEQLVHPPDVLVHLDASPEMLLDRIARRGRDFERTMTADFLNDMRNAYERHVPKAPCTIIHVDCETEDFRRPESLTRLLEKLKESP